MIHIAVVTKLTKEHIGAVLAKHPTADKEVLYDLPDALAAAHEYGEDTREVFEDILTEKVIFSGWDEATYDACLELFDIAFGPVPDVDYSEGHDL